MSAEERRESVIRAALIEFARGGYDGTSTQAIASRVGVSQPYLFRLFPGKQAIFLAAVSRAMRTVRDVMEEAGRQTPPGEDPVHSMAPAYQQLIADDPDVLLIQVQAQVAVAAAERSGDHEIGRQVRAEWLEIWDAVYARFGADASETTQFLGYGMLVNVLMLMGFPADHRVWTGFYVSAQPLPPSGQSRPEPEARTG